MTNCGGCFNIDNKTAQLKDLEQKTTVPDFWTNQQQAQKISQAVSDLRQQLNTFSELKQNFDDAKVLLDLSKSENDESTFNEVDDELTKILQKLNKLEFQAKLSDPLDKNNAILTLHSGAGGTEACDWCEMLLRMYLRWAERQGFETEITDILSGDEAGVKSVTFFISGQYAYGYLKSETGVHRLVRISPFDANKRRHTSFAACDVIPEIEDDIQIDIKESDLRIDTYRASGHGGQHVNKTDSAVRITHLPTGSVVACQNERSQFKNKQKAMKMLKAKLYEIERDKQRAAAEKHYSEKGDIAWGNQIRSYVFMPYQMVKDHRTDTETGNVTAVMDGEIDVFIASYLEHKILEK